ncbi:hypothetical protein GBAR_LOCUS1583 [Geodia barretti]|uniref:Uncharacterized protein n=1 Tax=Geodia barretti TaxID=519541 RepID=A0AA35QWM0_GEOBA|nr:hypothetical protein GBAR_LOCUS1583 [Geodia barretti]
MTLHLHILQPCLVQILKRKIYHLLKNHLSISFVR